MIKYEPPNIEVRSKDINTARNNADYQIKTKYDVAEKTDPLKIFLKAVLLVMVFAAVGIIYLLSPLDIIPDMIPIIGFLDDVIVLLGSLGLISGTVGYYLRKALKSGKGHAERERISSNRPHG